MNVQMSLTVTLTMDEACALRNLLGVQTTALIEDEFGLGRAEDQVCETLYDRLVEAIGEQEDEVAE